MTPTANGTSRTVRVPRSLMDVLTGNSTAITRQMFTRGQSLNPDRRRRIADECGYPDIASFTAWDYQSLYDTEPLAQKVVRAWPRECWAVDPVLYEEESAGEATEFEKALAGVSRSLAGCGKYFAEASGSPLWEALARLDELGGVGHYGVLLFGLNDGRPLSEPVKQVPYGSGRELLFLRVFPESLAVVTRMEQDRRSPRFGQPTEYQLTFNDPKDQPAGSLVGSTSMESVHWTRVLHYADRHHAAAPSEVFAVPRLRPVLYPVLDAVKVRGGSAEMYWLGALPGWSWETHPELGGDVDIDVDAFKDTIERFRNGLQRDMMMNGLTGRSLAPQVVDPSKQIEVLTDAIAVQMDMPKRILMGSERGQLSSAQDQRSWDRKVAGRQNRHCTTCLVRPFADRLIWFGVLPGPQKPLKIDWPELSVNDPAEVAARALQETQALVAYADSANAPKLVPPLEYFTGVLGRTDDEARAWVEASQAAPAPAAPAPGAGTLAAPFAPGPSANAWSDAAREAALEARRAHMKGAADTPSRATADGWVKESGVPEHLAEQFASDMSHVLDVMPHGCRKAAEEAVNEYGGGVKFHADLKAVTDACSAAAGKAEKGQVGGFVTYHARGDAARVNVDGGAGTEDARGIYAHEMGHAVDCGRKYSEDKKWQSAWKSEIFNGKTLLSRYARESPTEGFAEFHRVLCEKGVAATSAAYPKCGAFLKSKGLI